MASKYTIQLRKEIATKATMAFLVVAFLLILLVLGVIFGLIVLIDTSVSNAVGGGDYIENMLNSTLSDNTAHKVIEVLNSKEYKCTVQQKRCL